MKPTELGSIASFLDRLLDPEFVAGEWHVSETSHEGITVMPYATLSGVALDFVNAAYETGWVDSSFDWSEWARTAEASELQKNTDAIAAADAQQLLKLLTLLIRRDKYEEGSLLSDFECGLILNIVKRADALLKEMIEGGTALKKLSHAQAGALGEMLTLAKLTSMGIAAYMSPEGAPGHDLIAVIKGVPKSIEVKTRQFFKSPQEITRWPVDLETKGDADFFIFVELDLNSILPSFYMLTGEQVRSITKVFANGQGNCYPTTVRKRATRNDFLPLLSVKSQP